MSRQIYRQFHTSIVASRETHYDILKLPLDASIGEIKNKFKKLSLKLHPDMLKSQGLTEEELESKGEEYLKIKKSYEVLSNDTTRHEYDLHLGIRQREGRSTNAFFKRPGNTFHFHEKHRYNDVPHFDLKKHQERSERVEKRYMYNQKINQNIDTFGRDLYARNLDKNGPRKGIYRTYRYQPDIHNDEAEGKKIAIKLLGGVIGLFGVWYLLLGTYSTEKKEQKKEQKREVQETKAPGGHAQDTMEPAAEEKNSVSKSGNKMNVNNSYGMQLIKGNKRDDLEVLEEQISETAE